MIYCFCIIIALLLHYLIIEKAKPVEKQGRKTTGLDFDF